MHSGCYYAINSECNYHCIGGLQNYEFYWFATVQVAYKFENSLVVPDRTGCLPKRSRQGILYLKAGLRAVQILGIIACILR